MIRSVRIQIVSFVFGLFLVLMVGAAYAACSNPAEIEGAIVYNGDQNVPQICIGSQWIALGALNPSAGGGGCSNPTDTEGAIVYNADFGVLQYCDGSKWRSVIQTGSGTACGSTNTFNTAGTHSYTVPNSFSTITVKLWGGGGGGGTSYAFSGSANGGGGGSTTISSLGLTAGGGGGGVGASSSAHGSGGSGGTASGGDINTIGNAGAGGGSGANGGNAPNGGTGGAPGGDGTAPGAGGGGDTNYTYDGGGGGSGAYVEITYTSATLSPETSITDIVVGDKGAGGAWTFDGGSGAVGQASITCVP